MLEQKKTPANASALEAGYQREEKEKNVRSANHLLYQGFFVKK